MIQPWSTLFFPQTYCLMVVQKGELWRHEIRMTQICRHLLTEVWMFSIQLPTALIVLCYFFKNIRDCKFSLKFRSIFWISMTSHTNSKMEHQATGLWSPLANHCEKDIFGRTEGPQGCAKAVINISHRWEQQRKSRQTFWLWSDHTCIFW